MRPFVPILVLALLQGACTIDDLPFVYKPDVQQGNVVTQEMVDQLRAGMTRRQVEFVLGSPLLDDPFHPDRWDYVYLYRPNHERRQQKRLTVFFEGDALVALEGDFEPKDPALKRSGG